MSRQHGTPAMRQAKKKVFLEAYARIGTITHAAKAAGVSREQHYVWLNDCKDSDEYRKAFAEAEGRAIDRLELEAIRRASKGVKEPVYQGGVLVGHVRRYSDTLLIFLLKGARPHKYRDNYHLTGEVGIRPTVREDAAWFSISEATGDGGGIASGDETSVGTALLAGPVQDAGVRTPVGQNGNGSHGSTEGPRADEGHPEGGD